jgi:hypothetical protein
MYSNFSDNEVIRKGRKKVYEVVKKLELLLPNGNTDGVLDEGDAVYVIQKVKKGNQIIYRFRVIKFANTNKEQKIYSGAKENFKQYFEKNSSIEGDKKNNYTIPSITGLGGGILAYFVAERFGKSKIMYSLGGLLLGVTVGLFILKSKK